MIQIPSTPTIFSMAQTNVQALNIIKVDVIFKVDLIFQTRYQFVLCTILVVYGVDSFTILHDQMARSGTYLHFFGEGLAGTTTKIKTMIKPTQMKIPTLLIPIIFIYCEDRY